MSLETHVPRESCIAWTRAAAVELAVQRTATRMEASRPCCSQLRLAPAPPGHAPLCDYDYKQDSNQILSLLEVGEASISSMPPSLRSFEKSSYTPNATKTAFIRKTGRGAPTQEPI